MKTKPNNFGLAFASVAAALGASLLTYSALSLMAEPAGLKSRIDELSARTAEIERLKKSLARPSAYPSDAVCETGAQGGSDLFRRKLAAAGASAGASVLNIAAVPQAPDEGLGLQRVNVLFQASGTYGSVVGLLEGLDAIRPQIFIDKIDMTSGQSVSLKLTGRFYCSPVRL